MLAIPALITGGSKMVQGIFMASAAMGPVLLIGIGAMYVHYEGIPVLKDGVVDVLEDERDDAKLEAQKERTAHAQLQAKYQRDLAMAEADRLDAVADSIRAARRADRANEQAADFRRLADGYAHRMRIAVRKAKPVRSDGDPISPSPDGSGGDSEFVYLRKDQFESLLAAVEVGNRNTERLIKGRGFYLDLKREGRADALPEPEFGDN